MKCARCHSYYILPVGEKNLVLSAYGRIIINSSEIRVAEIYSEGIKLTEKKSPLEFKCMECGYKISEDIKKRAVVECTECYKEFNIEEIGFPETRNVPICKSCYEKCFSDESFTPLLKVLDKLTITIG